MKTKNQIVGSLRVDTINLSWNDPQYITPSNQEAKQLRWQQPDAYKKLMNARFAMLAAFCGWGKSTVQIALAIHDVVQSKWKQKQLIIVPQSHIHRGFVGDEDLDFIPIEVDGEIWNWKINHNFCDGKNPDILVDLKAWLLESGDSLSKRYRDHVVTGLNAVASHQALGMVWKKLTEVEKKKAIRNLTLRADEAHHIKGVFDVNGDDLTADEKLILEMESTNLGEICRFIFNHGDKNSKIHLTTATPYRGDRVIILSKDVLDQFEIYYLDWLEHWKTLGIKEFNLQYEEYDGDPIAQVVEKIKREPKEKHMIVIPSTTHKWRENGEGELQTMLNAIYKVIPKERVLDLVTPATQDRNKILLLQEPKAANKGESKFDVIVTCMLGREGTDWCPCSRLHNTACENSVTLAIQTMGRPFRRFLIEKNGEIVGGKTSVHIYYYVARFVEPKKGMTKRELLSDRTNALLICMQLDEMCHPILIPIIPVAAKEEGNHEEDGPRPHGNYVSLLEVFDDQYQKVKQELFEEVECLEKKTSEELLAVVEDILDEYNITENRDGVRDALLALALRALSPKLKSLGIDVAFLRKEGFDKIVEKYDIAKQSIFFGSYKGGDWQVIRSILKSKWEDVFRAYKAKSEERK